MLEPSSSEEDSASETVEEESSEATISGSGAGLEVPGASGRGSDGGPRALSPASIGSLSSLGGGLGSGSLATSGAASGSGSLNGESLTVATVTGGSSIGSTSHGGSRVNSSQRPSSPSPSVVSEKEKEEMERQEKEEEERKKRLQLYVFVLRCIAYPFNAKQPNDMARRQTKITRQQLDTLQSRFQAFLKGETQIVADEAFQNAVQSFYEVFLRSDRVVGMVQSGACSSVDFREVFKNNIEKRVRSLPEIDGLSKETVLTSWMTKFDAIFRGDEDTRKPQSRMQHSIASELILSKEQLYDMFQNILSIKKFEHQLLYNALQVRKH